MALDLQEMLKQTLSGKKILMIGVKFYHYNEAICNKMRSYGADVTFFYERNTSIKFTIVERFFKNRLDEFQHQHYKNILKKTENMSFDYLLVIRGYKMPSSFVKQIKIKNPSIKTIVYQWDANANSPFTDMLPNFDRKFSFDYKDVAEIPGLRYSPTFSEDEFIKLKDSHDECIYDLFYFGSFLPERYQGLLKFRDYANTHGYKLKIHFYLKKRYYFYLLYKGAKLDKNLVSTKLMSREEYYKFFKESKAIVDVSNKKQTGMAMRVIDALVANKKILTTNTWIAKDPIYNPDQILLVDLDNIVIPQGFLDKKIDRDPIDLSIDKWLYNMFIS